MKNLRKFFMEDWLEKYRFQAKFNLGESGGRPRSVKELLVNSGLSEEQISHTFLNTLLRDSPNYGRDDLRGLVALFHPGATRENVLITTGTSEALLLFFRYTRPQSIALMLPAFQLLYEFALAYDAQVIPLPVRFDMGGRPFINEDEWLSTLEKQKPQCLLLNHPHNPSGLLLKDDFIQKVLQLVEKWGCTVVGDEHYRFLSSEPHFMGSTLYSIKANTFVTGSLIKCIGAPGLRLGWCVGPQQAIDSMQNEKNYTTHTVNPFSEWIAYEVLKNQESLFWKNIKIEWMLNKNILKEFLAHSKNIYGTLPEGGLVTSLGFKNASSCEETNLLLHQFLEKGVFVLPLSSMEFGQFDFQKEWAYNGQQLSNMNKGFGFRLGLGCEPEKLTEALSLME